MFTTCLAHVTDVENVDYDHDDQHHHHCHCHQYYLFRYQFELVSCRLEGQDALNTEDLAQLKTALPSFLLFATTWSVGATCDKAGRVAFDMFLKSKAAGQSCSCIRSHHIASMLGLLCGVDCGYFMCLHTALTVWRSAKGSNQHAVNKCAAN